MLVEGFWGFVLALVLRPCDPYGPDIFTTVHPFRYHGVPVDLLPPLPKRCFDIESRPNANRCSGTYKYVHVGMKCPTVPSCHVHVDPDTRRFYPRGNQGVVDNRLQ